MKQPGLLGWGVYPNYDAQEMHKRSPSRAQQLFANHDTDTIESGCVSNYTKNIAS